MSFSMSDSSSDSSKPSPDGSASPAPSAYQLTPEQVAEAEEYSRLFSKMEEVRSVPLSEDPARQQRLLLWGIGGVLSLLVVGLLAFNSHAPLAVFGAAALFGLAAFLFANRDIHRPAIGGLGAALVMMGLWCLAVGLLFPPQADQALDVLESRANAFNQMRNAPWETQPAEVATAGGFRPSASPPTATGPPAATPSQPGMAYKWVGGNICQVTVQNNFSVTQHVFIDGQHMGTVPVRGNVTWDVSPGSHQIVSADSNSMSDNPVTDWFDVSRGQLCTFTVSLM